MREAEMVDGDKEGTTGKPYAHSKEGCPPAEWQPLEDHLRQVAEMAAGFATSFQSAEWAENAGWLHDLGKADSIFQGYLRRENNLDDAGYDHGRVNHSSAGAACAEDLIQQAGRILAYLVAGHHAGLPDWYPDQTGIAALKIRLGEGRDNLRRVTAFTDGVMAKIRSVSLPQFIRPENFHLWIRMLFSCLVDADFLETERFIQGEKTQERGQYPSLADLAPRLFQSLDLLERTAAKSSVNTIRSEIRRTCEKKAEMPKGMFLLTVPTGGGKTLSAMVFAMRHALKHGQRRIIYVIPYTSIIEQTGRTLADVFGRENVVEHHSNINPEKETLRSQLATENWDAPIIVTTNVQFFESLYAAKPSRCRKLHNIVNSVIILDEAQLLPPELLTPCVNAINDLVRYFNVTMVLATATQPALPKLDPANEIIPPEFNLYERLKRTEFTFPPDLNQSTDWQTLARKLQHYEQVLCVVNSRRDCYDLFKLMPEGTIHLSALMCGAHRSAMIRLIHARLLKGLPTRVISTQLVEAGVDIDFPVVFRALSGLDSIAQAAGRCNREGKLERGEVYVFVPPKLSSRGLLRKGEDVTRELSATGFDPHQPDAFTRYFKLFYSRVNDTGSRFNDWLVKDVNPEMKVQFRTAAQDFRLIDDEAQQSVIVRYQKSPYWIECLRHAGPTREIMRNLQRYTVNLPHQMACRMCDDGRMEEPWPGILAQSELKIYDRCTGLAVYDEQFPVEDLTI